MSELDKWIAKHVMEYSLQEDFFYPYPKYAEKVRLIYWKDLEGRSVDVNFTSDLNLAVPLLHHPKLMYEMALNPILDYTDKTAVCWEVTDLNGNLFVKHKQPARAICEAVYKQITEEFWSE
jgi:hypothetical protein